MESVAKTFARLAITRNRSEKLSASTKQTYPRYSINHTIDSL